MEFYKEGDKSKAICSSCKKTVTTTFKVQTSDIKDGGLTYEVPDILVAVCDECDQVAAVPQQSFAAIAEVRKKAEKRPVEIRIPRHLADILNNSIVALALDPTSDLRAQLVKIYLSRISGNPAALKQIRKHLASELLKGHFKKPIRLSLKVNPALAEQIQNFLQHSKLTRTELVDAVIVAVKEEICDKPNSEKAQDIREALLAVG